jgi:cell division protein FtsB
MGLLYYRPVHAYVETRHSLAERTAEVRTLAATKRTLEQRLVLTQSDATLVRAARQLGLVRPGERLFIVKDIAQWLRAHAARRSR